MFPDPYIHLYIRQSESLPFQHLPNKVVQTSSQTFSGSPEIEHATATTSKEQRSPVRLQTESSRTENQLAAQKVPEILLFDSRELEIVKS